MKQDGLRQLGGHTTPASFAGALIGRSSLNLIFFSAALKFQADHCLGLRPGILGPEHFVITVPVAGSSVEGKAYSIKNSRLSGAGVSGDEIKSLCAQCLKIYGLTGRVGAEGGHCQLQWSHGPYSSRK